jgi:predicted transcriptional regulator
MSTGSNAPKEDLIKQLRQQLSRRDLVNQAKISNYTITKYNRKNITDLGQKIINLRKQNKSVGEIAKILKCSKSTVSSYCHFVDPEGKTKQELISKRNQDDRTKTLFSKELKWIKKAKKSNYSGSFNYQMNHLYRYKIIRYYNSTCMLCDEKHDSLDFHHVDPSQKEFILHGKVRKPINVLIKEANKCSLLCSNCHTKVHKFKISDLPKINITEKDLRSIDIKNIKISEIDRFRVDFFCKSVHYLGYSKKGSIYNLGFFDGEDLVAVALIANPTRNESKINGEKTCELTRFLILGRVRTKNMASRCLSLIIKFLKKNSDYKHLISFADTGHHLGTIYKAANFCEAGKTKASYNYEGIHKKTIYERAKRLGMTEYEYVRFFNLERIKEEPKIKFVYSL